MFSAGRERLGIEGRIRFYVQSPALRERWYQSVSRVNKLPWLLPAPAPMEAHVTLISGRREFDTGE